MSATQEDNDSLRKREWAAGEKAAWLADKIVTGASDYCNEAADLLRNYSKLEYELAAANAKLSARTESMEFDATRVRRVAKLLGLETAIPDDDATLLGCIGSVMGMFARKIEAQQAVLDGLEQQEPVVEVVCINGMRAFTPLIKNLEEFVHGDKLYAQAKPALPAVPEWLPIETAPKDGTEILTYQPITKEQFVVFFDQCENRWQFAIDTYLADAPTHWMPLPKAPQPHKEG